MSKGKDTRHSILDQAVELTSEVGLEGLTIGVLAKRAGLSKSGLYAHFESKENLQCDVLDRAASRWIQSVLTPAIRGPISAIPSSSLHEIMSITCPRKMTIMVSARERTSFRSPETIRIPPFSRCLRIAFQISSVAPISNPRVGCSAMSKKGC